MKMSKAILPLIMITLSLTGCSSKRSLLKRVAKNGDLISLNEINYENSMVDVSFEKIDKLINSEEKFVFYLMSKECHACVDFKDVITSYVQDTNTLVYRMDILGDDESYNLSPDFQAFYDKYDEYFFINHKIQTPQVYVVKGVNVAEQVPFSRYAQKWMFKKAMSEYVKAEKFTTFTSVDSYNKFIELNANKKYITLLVDENNVEAWDLYKKYVSDFKSSNYEVACIYLNDTNKAAFTEMFGEQTFYAKYTYKDNVIDANKDNIEEFIKKYL